MTLTLERPPQISHEPPDISAAPLPDFKLWERGLLRIESPEQLERIIQSQRKHAGELALARALEEGRRQYGLLLLMETSLPEAVELAV